MVQRRNERAFRSPDVGDSPEVEGKAIFTTSLNLLGLLTSTQLSLRKFSNPIAYRRRPERRKTRPKVARWRSGPMTTRWPSLPQARRAVLPHRPRQPIALDQSTSGSLSRDDCFCCCGGE